MRTALILDTETNGLPNYKKPLWDKDQPRIVELAALLIDEEDGRELGMLNAIIQPQGWTIPPELTELHGISTALAEAAGVPLAAVFPAFCELARRADVICAHNLAFDFTMVQIASYLLGWEPKWLTANKETFDTMHASTNILRLPRRSGGLKTPKLSECYQFYFKEPLQDAHRALHDCRACARVYTHLKHRVVSVPAPVPVPVIEGTCPNCDGSGSEPCRSCVGDGEGPCTCGQFPCAVCNGPRPKAKYAKS